MWYICTMAFQLAMKKNEIVKKNCMKVENAILTEVIKAQKGKLLHKQKT